MLKNTRLYYTLPISVFDFKEGGKLLEDEVLCKLFLGFIHIHVLHHAKEHPTYGAWMDF